MVSSGECCSRSSPCCTVLLPCWAALGIEVGAPQMLLLVPLICPQPCGFCCLFFRRARAEGQGSSQIMGRAALLSCCRLDRAFLRLSLGLLWSVVRHPEPQCGRCQHSSVAAFFQPVVGSYSSLGGNFLSLSFFFFLLIWNLNLNPFHFIFQSVSFLLSDFPQALRMWIIALLSTTGVLLW